MGSKKTKAKGNGRGWAQWLCVAPGGVVEDDDDEEADVPPKVSEVKPTTSRLKTAAPLSPSYGQTTLDTIQIGCQDEKLRDRLAEKYEIEASEVEEAMEFAESDETAEVFCLAFVLTGGPMDPCAFQAACEVQYDSGKLLESYSNPSTGYEGRTLRGPQLKAKKRVLRMYKPKEEERHTNGTEPEAQIPGKENEEISEEQLYRIEKLEESRLRALIQDKSSTEDKLRALGVPGPGFSEAHVHKALHPSKSLFALDKSNNLILNHKDQAKRKAAHRLALEVLREAA